MHTFNKQMKRKAWMHFCYLATAVVGTAILASGCSKKENASAAATSTNVQTSAKRGVNLASLVGAWDCGRKEGIFTFESDGTFSRDTYPNTTAETPLERARSVFFGQYAMDSDKIKTQNQKLVLQMDSQDTVFKMNLVSSGKAQLRQDGLIEIPAATASVYAATLSQSTLTLRIVEGYNPDGTRRQLPENPQPMECQKA